MFTYPRMPNAQTTQLAKGEKVWVFDKLDGSNLAWEWSEKRGWFRQTTRQRLFDASDYQFGFALAKFDELLEKSEQFYSFQKLHKPKSMIVVTELFGPESFAGSHGDPKGLSLFVLDLIIDGRFLLPKELTSQKSKGMPMPRVISTGDTIWDQNLVDKVRANHYNSNEGVVAKSASRAGVFAKIKTHDYLKRIKAGTQNWQDHWE